MTWEPTVPGVRHVWVRGAGEIGPPDPGVVVDWQRAPVHNTNTSEWIALVACCPFDTALLVPWPNQTGHQLLERLHGGTTRSCQ